MTAKIKGIAKEHDAATKEVFILQPMDNWHLRSDFKNGKPAGGRMLSIHNPKYRVLSILSCPS